MWKKIKSLMKKKREETFPNEQKMWNATNNLKPHLLTKVGAGKEATCSAASAWICSMKADYLHLYPVQHPPLSTHLLAISNPRVSRGHTGSPNRFWWSRNNSIPGLSEESRCTVCAGKGGRALQRQLRAFKKSFQSLERLRQSRTGPGISLRAR